MPLINRSARALRAGLYTAFSSQDGALKRKGPYKRLLFEVEIVRERPAGPVIAQHRGHAWHVDGERFTRLDVEGRTELQFLDGEASERSWPSGLFSTVDGVAYREGQVLAYIDLHSGKWIRTKDGRAWPVLLVEPATR